MKRFLYYDQESVNSFLAQIEQGVLVRKSQEGEDACSNTSTKGNTADLAGDIGAKLLGLGATIKGNLQEQDITTEAATTLIRSVQEKILHDYAFEIVFDYLNNNNIINNDNPEIGDIVLTSENPTFLDFKYFQSLFAENGAIKVSNDENKANAEKMVEEIKDKYKGGKMPQEAREAISQIKAEVTKAEEERKDLLKTIEVIRNTLPYNRFLMTNNMLMPLEDRSFRDNPEIVAFKYGGQMNILGYVTNIVSSDKVPERNNDFASFYDVLNQIMIGLFKDKTKIFIVHPVAVFY